MWENGKLLGKHFKKRLFLVLHLLFHSSKMLKSPLNCLYPLEIKLSNYLFGASFYKGQCLWCSQASKTATYSHLIHCGFFFMFLAVWLKWPWIFHSCITDTWMKRRFHFNSASCALSNSWKYFYVSMSVIAMVRGIMVCLSCFSFRSGKNIHLGSTWLDFSGQGCCDPHNTFWAVTT